MLESLEKGQNGLKGGSRKGDDTFETTVGDENFDFRTVTFNDLKVTGSQVAAAVGANPITQFVVLHWLPNGELDGVLPNESVELKDGSRFFVIKGDGTDRFFVDGLSLQWPKETIKGKFIKRLVGKGEEGVELLLERENQPDKIIENDEDVRIGRNGVEELKTRVKGVTLIVNGTPHKWTEKKISYTEVVQLEFLDYPQDPPTTYSVKYRKGPGNKPEGELTKGQSTPVKDRMEFKVSPTGQS
jgi:hypothetical protein